MRALVCGRDLAPSSQGSQGHPQTDQATVTTEQRVQWPTQASCLPTTTCSPTLVSPRPIRHPLLQRRETVRVLAMLLVAFVVDAAILPAADAQSRDIFIPLLVYRTGPYASSGAPVANGRIDYCTLVNDRDGGVNGVKIAWEECEFR